jgi:hypothetical protein
MSPHRGLEDRDCRLFDTTHWQNQQRETCARIVYEKGRQSKGEALDFDTNVEAARRQYKHSLSASHLEVCYLLVLLSPSPILIVS